MTAARCSSSRGWPTGGARRSGAATRARGGVLVEQGLADVWAREVGDRSQAGDRRGPREIAGITVAPDNVAFPLSSAPRVYISLPWLQDLGIRGWQMNQALIWTAAPERT